LFDIYLTKVLFFSTKANMSLVAFGLDISSLFCRVAIASQGVVSNTQGARYTPGLVAKEEEGSSNEYIFGDAAQRLSSHKTLSVAIQEEPEAAKAFLAYLIQLAADNAAVTVDRLRLTVSIPTGLEEENITMWLNLVTAAAKSLISDKKKRKQDFVVGVVNREVAACLAYEIEKNETVLVVDMDGRDVLSMALMACENSGWYLQQQYETVDKVSGPVMVELLANFVATQFERQQRIPRGEVMGRKKARNKLLKEAERVLLSGSSGSMEFMLDGLFEGIDCHLTVSKPRWEMIKGSLFRDVEVALTMKKESGFITSVLCSGAWSPLLLPSLQKIFGNIVRLAGATPEESVVLGCAKQAAFSLQKEGMAPTLMPTVTVPASPVSIGISEGDEFLISEGTPLPAKTTYTISKPCKLLQFSPRKKELANLEGIEGETIVTVELSIEGQLSIGLVRKPVVVA